MKKKHTDTYENDFLLPENSPVVLITFFVFNPWAEMTSVYVCPWKINCPIGIDDKSKTLRAEEGLQIPFSSINSIMSFFDLFREPAAITERNLMGLKFHASTDTHIDLQKIGTCY